MKYDTVTAGPSLFPIADRSTFFGFVGSLRTALWFEEFRPVTLWSQ